MPRKSAAIALILACLYGAVSLLFNPNSSLLTDVGGKTATLESMVQNDNWDLGLGYWFEEYDSDGIFYPLSNTGVTENGKWINTTSYTMVYLARPLWAIGGARLAVLIPILGAVVSALAAGALHRRLFTNSDGALSVWIVGLATPVAIYGFEIWEHSWGLALMTLGLVHAIDAMTEQVAKPAQSDRRWELSAFWAGAAFGLAGTMRQEALVYGFVTGVVLLVVLAKRKRLSAAATRGGAMIIGTLAVQGLYTLGEIVLLGGSLRVGRTSGRTSSLAVDFTTRLEAGATTTLFPTNSSSPANYVFGALILIAIAALGVACVRRQHVRFATYGVLTITVAYCLTLIPVGLSFVPGLFPTTPLAAAGLGIGLYSRRWLALALGALPAVLVVLVQYSAGSFVQWGGRYLLLSGLVLAVVAIGSLETAAPKALAGIGALGLAITIFGLTWSITREDQVAADLDRVSELVDKSEVVLWRDPNIAREAGVISVGTRWLSAPTAADQLEIAQLLVDADIDSFIWVDAAGGELEEFAGFESGQELGELDFFEQRLTRFHRN